MKHLVCESLQEFLSNNQIRRIVNEEIDDTQYTEYNENIPKEKYIKNKEVKEVIDKIDNDPEQEIEKSQTSKIKTVPLPSKRKGFECLAEIQDNDAFDHPGQGLYIWTNKSFLESGKNYYKVGQYGAHAGEAKTPDATIASYAGTFVDNIVIVFVIKLDDYLNSPKNLGYKDAHEIEKEVHRRILSKNKGYHMDLGKSTELFAGVTLQDHIKNISSVLTGGEGRLKNFKMRPEQKEAHDKIIDWFQKSPQISIKPKEFLLAAKMRYGKNFTFLNVAKTMNMKNILVLTYKPHVFQSLKNDINDHEYFEGWKFVEFKNQRDIFPLNYPCQVIVSSAQLAQHKTVDPEEAAKESIEKIRKNIKSLSRIPFDMVVADEYHYGTSTINFKEVLDNLNYKYIIYVSGTAMKDIAAGRFDDDQLYTYDYIDEQKKKRAGSKDHKDMPTMEFHLMYIDDKAKQIGDWYTPEEGFNMAKLITVNSDGKLRNEGAMEILLRQIMGAGYHDQMSPFKLKAGLDHTLWVFDKNVKGIKAVASLMRKMPEYQNFDIIEATGNVVTDINEVVERINKAEDQGKRTITMTCYRFKEGVTIPQWNGAIMLDQGKSVEEYLQAIFRTQSPNREKEKDRCYVFDFNPQRCLQIIYDTCENIDKTGKRQLTETIIEFLDNANVLDHFGNKLTSVNFDKVIENFREHGSFSEKFANTKNVNVTKIDEDIINSLEDVASHTGKKEIVVNDQDVELGKTSIQHRVSTDGEEEAIIKPSKDQVKKYLQKIQTVLSNIPEYLFNSPESEKTVEEILVGKERELFEEITGVTLDTFKMWCDKDLINKVLLNRNILAFNDAEQKFLESKPSVEEKEKFFNQHFNMRAEEGATPAALVNEMLDKLPKDVWTDPKKTFCDPCMGTGTFLIAIKERLMEQLISIPEEKREAYIVNNMLYGCDINQSKVNIVKKLLGNSNHIIKEDSLKYNWNNMKFDVIVGNPPYQGEQRGGGKGSGNSIWQKFVELSFNILKDEGYLCFVHPCGWRMPPVSRKIQAARNLLITNQIEYLNLYTTPFKGVNIVVDWYVAKKLPKYKETEIRYVNGTYKKYIDDSFILNYGGPLMESIENKVLTVVNNGLKTRKGFGGLVILDKTKPKGKYKFAHGARFLRNEWKYYDYPHIDQFKPKVIISAVGPFRAIYDKGEIGISDHVHYLLVNNEKEANFYIKIITSKLSNFLQKVYASVELHSTYDLPARWNIPGPISKIKLDDVILKTDKDIYNYFSLTQEEIDYIESQIK